MRIYGYNVFRYFQKHPRQELYEASELGVEGQEKLESLRE